MVSVLTVNLLLTAGLLANQLQPPVEPDAILHVTGAQWYWDIKLQTVFDAQGPNYGQLNDIIDITAEYRNFSKTCLLLSSRYILVIFDITHHIRPYHFHIYERQMLYRYFNWDVFDTTRFTIRHVTYVYEQRALPQSRYILGKGTLFNTVDLANLLPNLAVSCLITDSKDVIHSYWIWALAIKLDCISGKPNEQAIDPDHSCISSGDCAEYCGKKHTQMPTIVKVYDPEIQLN